MISPKKGSLGAIIRTYKGMITKKLVILVWISLDGREAILIELFATKWN